MASILDIEGKITENYLRENRWVKTPSFTSDRNPWWSKEILAIVENGRAQAQPFAYNDETGEVMLMRNYPYAKETVKSITELELFIKIHLS